jgi:hypothetical protein
MLHFDYLEGSGLSHPKLSWLIVEATDAGSRFSYIDQKFRAEEKWLM